MWAVSKIEILVAEYTEPVFPTTGKAGFFVAMITSPSSQVLTPLPGESPERFTIRAHRSLASRVPDHERRNAIVRAAWEKSRGNPQTEQARKLFSPDRYEVMRDVCVFAEHEAGDGKGGSRKFDARELAKIVRNCNERIEDVGAFPAIADGHTSDDASEPEPEIIGYAGNFRLGQIGNKNPRWAIFCDEYRAKECLQKFASKPRRSVELWTYSDSGRSHFDPIAALGASSPRLPLPMRFASSGNGSARIVRYSAVAVQAGGGNTFVTGFRGKKPRKSSHYQQEPKPMLSPEDKAEIVEAISSLPQFKFLDQLMREKQQPEQPDRLSAEEFDDDIPTPGAEELPTDDDLDDIAGLLEDDEEDPKKPEQFSGHRYSDAANRGAMVQRYAVLERSHKKLLADHAALHQEVRAQSRAATDQQRLNRLESLGRRYEHFVDVEEEKSLTLYSMGANLSDEQFEAHVTRLERQAQRAIPSMASIPRGEYPAERNSAKYSQQRAELAVQICTDAVSAGRMMTYEDGLAEADKRLKG